MCNINIFIKTNTYLKTREELKALTGFLQSTTSCSYSANNHGDGIFLSSGKLVKSEAKVNIVDLEKDIKNSNFIITHQRLSTSGLSEDIHPFMFGDLVMVHNGIINSYVKGEHSDSYNLFKELEESFQKEMETGATSRQNGIVMAIQNIFKEIYASASYSIAIYDRVDKAMYYFKNVGRYINVYVSDNSLYMSTSIGNKEFLTMVPEDYTNIDLQELTIYRFIVNEKIEYLPVGTIIPKPYEYTKLTGKGYYCTVYDDDDEESRFKVHGNHQHQSNSSDSRALSTLFTGNYEDTEDSRHREINYEDELENYKTALFQKCRKYKKCSNCSEVTRYITKKTQVRICESCMVEQMVKDMEGFPE